MWILFAFGSAFFAGITAILAKCGIRKTDSTVATAVRTIVVLLFSWLMVFVVGSQDQLGSIDPNTWLFLILSGLATGASWLCYFRALQLGDINKVVPVDKSSVILTMLLAFLFLQEPITPFGGVGVVLIAAGTFLMIEKKDVEQKEDQKKSWFLYAAGSAIFASLTSILGKIGISGVESNLGTAIRTAVEAGVDAVVSGAGLPLELPGLVNTMEVAIAPIVSSGRAAKLILRRWAKEFGRTADFVVIEGCKAGGHLGFAEQDLFSGTCQTLDEILPEVLAEVKPYEAQFGHSIPVFVAGGVYTGADLAHFTRLGAAGVQLATRFITTYECDASQGYKDVLLNAGSEDVRIIHSPVGMPGRALNTPLVQAMAEGRRFPPRHCARCLKTCDPVKVPYCITHALIEAVKGNLEEGLFFCGANVGRLDRMYTVRELMDELVTEWRQNR